MSVAIHSQGLSAQEHCLSLFLGWSRDGTLDRIHDALYVKCREKLGSRPVRALASSIARASRAQKKGGPHRSARLRCRQADQGKEAPYSRRHARSGFTRAHHASQRARSGRRPAVAVDFVWNVSVSQKALRRQRLPGACVSNRARIGSAAPRNRNHQTAARCQGLRRATQTMDCRTEHRVVEPLPETGQGLGESEHQRPHFPTPRLNPPHAPKARMPSCFSISVRSEASVTSSPSRDRRSVCAVSALGLSLSAM